MATFVLVHGAWHGGWCWRKVTPLLQADGHRVYAPTLTGLGDRAHLLTRQVNLTTHVQDTVALLEYEDLREVVLVGHSYGGMVITAAAEQAGRRLKHVVYLDAIVPQDGEALLPPGDPRQPHRVRAARHGDGWKIPPPRPGPDGSILGVRDEGDLQWLAPRLTPHPLASFEEPARLPGQAARKMAGAYVLCTGRRNAVFARMARRAASYGYRNYQIDTGHDLMVTAPEQTADVLLAIAREA